MWCDNFVRHRDGYDKANNEVNVCTHVHTHTLPLTHAYSCCDNKVELGASVNCFAWQLVLCVVVSLSLSMSMSFPLLLLCCCRWLCLCRCLASADVLIESAPWRSMPKNTQKEVVNFLAVVQGKWRRRDTERGGAVHHTPCCLRDAISTTHTHMSPTWWAAPLSTRSSSFCLCQANFRRNTQVVGSTWHYPDTRPDPDDAKWNGFWSNENCMHIIRPKKELFIHFEDMEFDRKPK